MENEEIIDLRAVKKIVLEQRLKISAIIVACTLITIAIAFLLPKQYESTTLLKAKSQKGGGFSLAAASAMAILGGGGATASPTQAYIELMKSRAVLDPIIAEVDLPDEKKEQLDAKTFAKNNLKIANTKGTDLIEVTAVGRSPEEAQQISGGVVKSFQMLLTKMNQTEQSLMVKFLNDRIVVAKQELEKAEQELEKFRQKEKVYIPDEQAKAVIKKMTEFDQKIAEYEVKNGMNQAKLNEVKTQLDKQNVAIARYNIADNSIIQDIRSEIIKKQIALIGLEQKYTEKHPSVILAKNELADLGEKLSQEVDASLKSGANTLNPVHGGLLKEKVQSETDLMAGIAAVDAMKKQQAENDTEISKLSEASVTYIGLERKVKVAQEVYGVLLKNYEQTRIQEAMESMDIQIVDDANLPKSPSAPRKVLMTALGFLFGSIVSFIYIVVAYLRTKKRSL